MKVLMITNALSEGGVESLLFDLCNSLVNIYHYEVAILVLNRKEIGLKKTFEEAGITVFVGKYSHIYNPLNIFLIRHYMSWGDIVHVHLYPCQLFAILAQILIPFPQRHPLITTEHSTFNRRRKFSIFKKIDSIMYAAYTKIVCISKQTEENLKKWLDNKAGDSICTINNGIDIEKFCNAPNELDHYIEVSADVQYLVMVGRLEYPKDQKTIIRAVQDLPLSIHLLLVGSGSELEECKKLAKNCGVSNRVHFLGNCKNVPVILKGCRIGILSTVWDGFGLVAVEYMAAGIPVVASDVDAVRDIVGTDKLLFEVGNEKDLVSKILSLLDNEEFYQVASNYCLVRARNYSMQTMIKEYVSVYESVLK